MEVAATAGEDRTIGRYHLVRPLGRGGMGEVWEAVLHGPHGFRKPVALKLLPQQAGSEDAARRLAFEARLGAMLQHPNVVSTLDLGVQGDRWYVAMELVRGASAHEVARSAPMSGPALLQLAQQACAALEHVHGLEIGGKRVGLVHRDVKPSNLLVDRSGLVKLTDLGVARLQGRPGGAAGTPGYMAPEQAVGRDEARSDLFALGATVLALATGRLPFGRGHDALEAIRRIEERLADRAFLEPVDALVPGLAAVVHRCLRLDPAHRYADAGEVARALAPLRAWPGPGLLELLVRARPDLGRGETTGSVRPEVSSDAPTRVLTKGNLPVPRDRYVGREEEKAAVVARISAGPGIVTLHGLGGAGKTRLAIEATREAARAGMAAWFVDLSDAPDATSVASAVARTLGVKIAGDHDAVGIALAGLGRAVVVLDNLEQVADAVAPLVSRWTRQATEATLVCTSRVALRVAGEVRIPVDALSDADAAALLAERAGRPLTANEQGAVPALVAALEGLPLAIELAAGRLRLLDAAEVLRRLADRLRLLAGGDRDRPERQRSLRASLEGSWELLTPWARSALSQLALFEGGASLESAEAVLDLTPFRDAPWAIDVLTELTDASLLRCDAATRRFGMLAAVQEFAAGKLSAEERTAAEVRHGLHFAQHGVPEALEAVFRRGAQARLEAVLADRDNLVVAARRAVTRRDGAVAARCVQAAMISFQLQGPIEAGVTLAGEVLALDTLQVGERVGVEHDLAYALSMAGQVDEGMALMQQALDRARQGGLRAQATMLLVNVATRHRWRGEHARALELLEEALALSRTIGSRRLEGIAMDMLGLTLRPLGRSSEARDLQRAAVEVFREIGNRRSEGVALSHLGDTFLALGEIDEAAGALEAALQVHRDVQNRRSEAHVLVHLAEVALARGRLDEAEAAYEAALHVRHAVGVLEVGDDPARGLAWIARARGEPVRAAILVEAEIARVRDRSPPDEVARLLATRAHLALDAGTRPDPWLDEADRAAPGPAGRRYVQGTRGLAAARAGDLEAARRHLGAALDAKVEAWVGWDALFAVELAAVSVPVDPAGARVRLDAALAALREDRGAPLLAEGLARAAEVAWALGDAEEAHRLLAEAEVQLARLGEAESPIREAVHRAARGVRRTTVPAP